MKTATYAESMRQLIDHLQVATADKGWIVEDHCGMATEIVIRTPKGYWVAGDNTECWGADFFTDEKYAGEIDAEFPGHIYYGAVDTEIPTDYEIGFPEIRAMVVDYLVSAIEAFEAQIDAEKPN